MRSTVFTSLGFVLGASAGALTPMPTHASQLAAVCTTDEQTLASIRADSDQTLWIFMQSVCKGEYKVSAARPRTAAAPSDQLETLIPPQVAVQDQRIGPPEGLDELAVSTTLGGSGFNAAESLPTKNPELQTRQVDETTPAKQEHQAKLASVSNQYQTGETGSNGLLYSLFNGERWAPENVDGIDEWLHIAEGFTGEGRKHLKPIQFAAAGGTFAGTGLSLPSSKRHASPVGWYTSIFAHHYEEPGLMQNTSIAPSLSVGVADERAIREHSEWRGFGYRAEIGFGVTRYTSATTGSMQNFNYFFQGESYFAIHNGFYTGLGYRYFVDDKVPNSRFVSVTSTGHRAYDRISQYFYVPFGVGFTFNGQQTAKLQFNYLLEGEQLSRLSQTGLDVDIKKRQGKGYGFDFAWAPNSREELFLRYWSIGDSEKVTSPLTGLIWYEPKNTTAELGYRVNW